MTRPLIPHDVNAALQARSPLGNALISALYRNVIPYREGAKKCDDLHALIDAADPADFLDIAGAAAVDCSAVAVNVMNGHWVNLGGNPRLRLTASHAHTLTQKMKEELLPFHSELGAFAGLRDSIRAALESDDNAAWDLILREGVAVTREATRHEPNMGNVLGTLIQAGLDMWKASASAGDRQAQARRKLLAAFDAANNAYDRAAAGMLGIAHAAERDYLNALR